MRILILLFFIAILVSCNTKQTNDTKPKGIDTSKLFDPSGENDGINKLVKAKNFVIMARDFYLVVFNDGEYRIPDKTRLAQLLSDSISIINKKKFYVVTDSTKTFEQIVEVLDILKHAKIDNYQVFDLRKLNNIPEPLIVQEPTSVSERSPLDSTFLKITLGLNNYKISLMNDSLITSSIQRIDKFISKNISLVNENKIIVLGQARSPFIQFKKIKTVLKKYKLYKFSVVTE